MRGPVDECVYPLTGYPPMDKAAWMRVLSICKSYGSITCVSTRGVRRKRRSLQPTNWASFSRSKSRCGRWTPRISDSIPERDRFIVDELDRILEAYGNHPSFALMAMGNESAGTLGELVQKGRSADPAAALPL